MENEENIGLIHKKAYEDHFLTFYQFNFGAISLFSLSYSWRIRVFLEHCKRVWHTWIFWSKKTKEE